MNLYRSLLIALFYLTVSYSSLISQTSYYYPLTGDFNEASAGANALFAWPNAAGQTGTFTNRSIPVSTCASGGNFQGYEYYTNAGLSFDIPNGYMNCEYSIQFTWNYDNPATGPGQTAHEWIRILSFGYTDDSGIELWTEPTSLNGKLYLWYLQTTYIFGFPICLPDTGSLSPSNYFNTTDYYRVTFTRNCSDQIKAYVNGVYVGGFTDVNQKYLPQAGFDKIVFFRDTVDVSNCYLGGQYPNEASAGFIKDLIISNRELSTAEVLNDFTNFCPSVLPVSWNHFTGKPTNLGNDLQWNMADTDFIDHFEVERGSEENNFAPIGIVDLTDVGDENFSFLDRQPPGNISYYRIKAIDWNGNISFSKVLVVRSELTFSVYPNPAQNHIWIELPDFSEGHFVEIFHIDGRRLLKTELKAAQNKISLSGLPAGILILKIDRQSVRRIVKAK